MNKMKYQNHDDTISLRETKPHEWTVTEAVAQTRRMRVETPMMRFSEPTPADYIAAIRTLPEEAQRRVLSPFQPDGNPERTSAATSEARRERDEALKERDAMMKERDEAWIDLAGAVKALAKRDVDLGKAAEAHRQRDEARLDYANTVSLAKRERALADDRVSELERERDTYERQRDEARGLLDSMKMADTREMTEDERIDSVRYALRDAFEYHLRLCVMKCVVTTGIPEETIADSFLMELGKRDFVVVHKKAEAVRRGGTEDVMSRLSRENVVLKKQLEVSSSATNELRVEMHLALKKIDYVNEKLGIFVVDSFEHFREELNNALDKGTNKNGDPALMNTKTSR